MIREGIAGSALVRDDRPDDEHSSWKWRWRVVFGVVCTVVAGVMIFAAIPAAAADSISTEGSFLVSRKPPDATNKGDSRCAPIPQTKLRDFTARGAMASDSEDTVIGGVHDSREFEGTNADLPAWTHGFEDTDVKDAVADARSLCREIVRMDASCAANFGCERLNRR